MAFRNILNGVNKKLNDLANFVPEFENNFRNKLFSATQNVKTQLEGLQGEAQGALGLVTNKSPFATQNPTQFKSNLSAKPGPIGHSVRAGELVPGVTPPPWPNELEDYSSMNAILGLHILTQDEINKPELYRTTKPKWSIIQNGGGAKRTGKESRTRVEQAMGASVEFFMDNLNIQSIVMMGSRNRNSNATKIEFEVYEPYSMGLFYQALLVAAKSAGFGHYIQAPFLLTIDFKGYDVDGNVMDVPYGRRLLPIKLINSQFVTNEGGSTYKVEAIAWNEQALHDSVTQIKTDVALRGRTIREMLQTGAQSLTEINNKRLKELKEKNQVAAPDQYVILFPGESEPESIYDAYGAGGEFDTGTATAQPGYDEYGAIGIAVDNRPTTDAYLSEYYQSLVGTDAGSEEVPGTFAEFYNGLANRTTDSSLLETMFKKYAASDYSNNKIGSKWIIDDPLAGGTQPMNSQGLADQESLSQRYPIFNRTSRNLQLSDDIRVFSFKAGTRIQEIIEEVLISSQYGRALARQLNDLPEDGMVDWYDIQTDTYVIKDEEELQRGGQYPSLYVYRVVPKKYGHEHFAAVSEPTQGVAERKVQAAKEYNYVYTGKNKSVLDFNIEYNYAFLAPFTADRGSGSAADRVGAAEGQAARHPHPGFRSGGDGAGTTTPVEGQASAVETVNNASGNDHSSGIADPQVQVARAFNDRLIFSNVDMIRVDMRIVGDPFWLSDNGVGNYHARDTAYTAMTADGQVNTGRSEVYCNVIFRTPIDTDPTSGKMIFPEDLIIVDTFSGLYRVIQIQHKFEEGVFTQELQMIRMRNQEEAGPSQNVGALVPITNPAESVNEITAEFAKRLTATNSRVGDTANRLDWMVEAENILPGFNNLRSVITKTRDIIGSDAFAAFGQVASAFETFQNGINIKDLAQIGTDFNALTAASQDLLGLTQLNLNGGDVLGNIGSSIGSNLQNSLGQNLSSLNGAVTTINPSAYTDSIMSSEQLLNRDTLGVSPLLRGGLPNGPVSTEQAINIANQNIPVQIPTAIEQSASEAASQLQRLNEGNIDAPSVNLPRADLGGNIRYNTRTGRWEGGF